MTVNIMMMIDLLTGTMVIKTQDPENTNKRRINAYFLASS